MKEIPSKQAFKEEILQLFNHPKNQIPQTDSSQDLLLDLPTLDLIVHENTPQEAFSFLDYLENNDII